MYMERYGINVKMRWTKDIQAEGKVYALCILPRRLKFRFDKTCTNWRSKWRTAKTFTKEAFK